MSVIHPIIFHNDLEVLSPDLPIEQPEQSIDHDCYAKIEHKGEDDRADEILECHVGLKWV